LTTLTEAKVKLELQRTQDIISGLTGKVPHLFRAPYGEYNDTLIHVARQLGLLTVQFDVESGDPDTTFTAERLVKWVTREARNGSVVIMHINNRGWHTAEALPAIIDSLKTKGYRLVTVGDLLKETAEQIGLFKMRIAAAGEQRSSLH
ncbi:MAG TPA: polysaccharide deacetylase family protein, partial [Bacteroidota bacterium]|nr:polysaccharide deacetylase family protein [Bacteroidota bacterium]